MRDVIIRDMEPADREAVVDLIWLLIRLEDAITGDRATDRQSACHSFKDDLDKLRPLGGAQFVATMTGKVVGYVCCAITQGGPYLREELRIYGYVTTLVVAPEARKLGLGEALMRTAEDFTRGQGLRSFAVGHVAGNEEAARLYERLGLATHAVERLKWLD